MEMTSKARYITAGDGSRQRAEEFAAHGWRGGEERGWDSITEGGPDYEEEA